MAPPSKPRVLIVDDKLSMAQTVADGLIDLGYAVEAIASGQEALRLLARDDLDAVVTDLRMPDVDGMEIVTASRRLAPDRPVIVMTAYGAVDSAVEAIRRGAYHYLTKPFQVEELGIFLGRALEEVRVRREARTLKNALDERFSVAGIVGHSAAMRDALSLIPRVAASGVPVLIQGETGTGKGLWARALHSESPRRQRPFLAVNCAAIPEALLESELFGHVKGAFTGAVQENRGLFREAEGGTLLLDEIGETPPAVQAKLLQVLESKAVRSVGSTRETQVDVRVLAATHRDLRALVRTGAFREDLLYRIDVVEAELPALRHRREDIPELTEHLLAQARASHPTSPVERLSPQVMQKLIDHAWPGNVRELAHVLERVVILGRSPVAVVEDLPPSVVHPEPPPGPLPNEVVSYREIQTRYARWALDQMGGHKGRTAERLEVDAKTLAKWLSREPSDEGEESG